jgi:methylthioribose-1-phosphate isomerase
MWVRGAPLIGATAAYGVAVQMAQDPSDASLDETWEVLHRTRPTAINLRWALDDMRARLRPVSPTERAAAAFARADAIAEEDVEINRRIGEHGLAIIREIASRKAPGEPVRVLTHCNAGWPATVDWGTATSPIYHAQEAGIPVHVFVDETRPRNQGAQLTAWELKAQGVPHDLIVDNAGGHLMQHGEVDLVIVGTDRTTANGDVCNKIGTYLKALAAQANGVPFYVALPSPTIDWTVRDGVKEIPIEERAASEVTHVQGRDAQGNIISVQVSPDGTGARNPAFDVTPAHLVTGLITERGVCEASPEALAALFPDRPNRA